MIRHLHIRNFKSLRDVTVSLEPLTVLIGRSGTGKTNFIDALRFVRAFLSERGGDFMQTQGGPTALFCATASDPELRVEVAFDVQGFPGDFAYTLALTQGEDPFGSGPPLYLCEEKLVHGNRVLFHQRRDERGEMKWVGASALSTPETPGSSVLGHIHGIREVRIAHLALTESIGCYDFPGSILTGGMFNPGAGTALMDSGCNYLTTLNGIVNNLSELDSVNEIRAAMQRLNRSVTSVELEADRSNVLVSHKGVDEKILTFPLSQESEGFRRFLAHLIALYQQPRKQVLAFEEPEKGIYPGALAVLAEYFQASASRGRSQLILTTHSPELLKYFGPEHIRVVELENNETKIGPLAADQREAVEQQLLTTDELLTVDEARVSTSPPARAET